MALPIIPPTQARIEPNGAEPFAPFGYVAGWYLSDCMKCTKPFMASKRSRTCLACAIDAMIEHTPMPIFAKRG